AAPYVPDTHSLRVLAEAATGCQGCPLWRDAHQTVFGSGARSAPLVLVGEQPGDREDERGRPFVGPAGRGLWQCLEEAGVDSGGVYGTTDVQRLTHRVGGKRRIRQRPVVAEIEACQPWVAAELRVLRSTPVVLMGAVAARSLLGRNV